MADRFSDPLEEYASGLGPGAYSPQQGNGLPLSVQGGLPMGGSPSAPSAPPVTAAPPSFNRAPLAPMGTPPDLVQQMIQQNLLRQQQFSQVPRPGFDQRREQGVLTQQLEQLKGVSNIRSQDRQLQAQYLKQATDLTLHFHTLTAEQQKAAGPVFEPLLRTMINMSGGHEVPDDVIKSALSSTNVAQAFSTILNDPLLAGRKDADTARLMQSKDREKAAQDIEKEHEAVFQSLIQQHLPQAVAKLGGSPDKPIDSQVFAKMVLEDPQFGEVLKQSPRLQQSFNRFVNDPKNTDALAAMGVKTGKTAQLVQEETVKQALTLPNLKLIPETTVKYLLSVSKTSPQALNAMATQDPNRFAAYVKAATDEENRVLEQRAFQTGGAAAEAKLRVPEKASPAERKEITTSQVTGEKLAALERFYKPEYVGPITGRAGALREDYTGAITPEESTFRGAVKSHNNQLIKDITGAQMSEQEATRILGEAPQLNSPPVTFEARMRQSKENNILLQYKQREILKQTGGDTSGLSPLPPLPDRFKNHPELFKTSPPGKLPPVKRSGEPTVTGRP